MKQLSCICRLQRLALRDQSPSAWHCSCTWTQDGETWRCDSSLLQAWWYWSCKAVIEWNRETTLTLNICLELRTVSTYLSSLKSKDWNLCCTIHNYTTYIRTTPPCTSIEVHIVQTPCSICGHQDHISPLASPRAECFLLWQHHGPSGTHSTCRRWPHTSGNDANILTGATCTYNIQSCWVTAVLLKQKLDHGKVTLFSSHADRTRLLCLNQRYTCKCQRVHCIWLKHIFM